MHKKGTPTLKTIAQELQLSISTVSRALNDHPDIRLETKQLVKQCAEALNYAPNIFAKGFRAHRSHILGVIVPNIAHDFTSTILKGVLDEAELSGYRVIISESKNSEEKQTQMLRTMCQFGVDGILLSLSRKTKSIDSILKILEITPLVMFDKISGKIPCTQVIIDEEEAAYNVVEHLINTGKKRIAIIKETENSFNSEKRYAGYLRALKNHHLDIDEKIILSTEDISLKKGRMMTNILLSLKKRPDAIFAITDMAAIGAMQAIQRYQIKIPQEISVVGFSNSTHSHIVKPQLTTVDQPGNNIGKTAVKYLIEEIEEDKESIIPKTITLKTHLIVRDSSFSAS